MTTTIDLAPEEDATDRPRSGVRLTLGYLARILLGLFFAFPIIFMFVSSLKPDEQIFADLTSIKAFLPVGDISLDNYSGVFDTVPAARFLLNSIAISAVTVVVGLVVNSMAAFALSRMRWTGSSVVLSAVIATLVVPFETFALPLVWWVNKLPWLELNGFSLALTQGWIDTYRVQIFPFLANAFSIYLFYSYFQSIPKDLDEAARVDGAGWFRIYRSVVMPLAGPAIATVAILTFLPAWNSYLWPLMVVQSEELRPVMVGISYFYQLDIQWGQIMAYSTLITIPVLVLFLSAQRAFISSIASSGVKG
jgi:multiple sugar transport system permease protein